MLAFIAFWHQSLSIDTDISNAIKTRHVLEMLLCYRFEILNNTEQKLKTLHLNCLLFIYEMMQASKANECVSGYSKTVLCIKVKVLGMLSRGNTQKSFKCDKGPIFQVANLNRNLTLFRPSEPGPTARNGSLDM